MPDISCIIIEDEPLAAKVLGEYIAQVPFLRLEASFKDAIAATEWLHTHTTDLIFLDIHLPRLKGMAFLKSLPNPPAVIITTAYHQYAVEGFTLNVTDYLLKPIELDRFLLAVNKVKAAHSNSAIQLPAESKDYLVVNVQKKKVRILFAEIIYIESQREYVKIVTAKQALLTKMGTHEIESLLPGHLFKRIHRSFIISLQKINSFNAEMVELQGYAIPVGRGYRDVLDQL